MTREMNMTLSDIQATDHCSEQASSKRRSVACDSLRSSDGFAFAFSHEFTWIYFATKEINGAPGAI